MDPMTDTNPPGAEPSIPEEHLEPTVTDWEAEDPGSARLLVVDDDMATRKAIRRVLEREGHRVLEAGDGAQALNLLGTAPDLILLDVTMPKMGGLQFLERLRADPSYAAVPVIMVTGSDGKSERLQAVEAGANDFIAKPFDVPEIRIRTRAQLRQKRLLDRQAQGRRELAAAVARRTKELQEVRQREEQGKVLTENAHWEAFRRLGLAAELRDGVTAAHVERIGRSCEILAEEMGVLEDDLTLIGPASTLHDIGKIGIPDEILMKPGSLDLEERLVMEQHTLMGARILHGSESPVLQLGATIALSHHERWDGRGYPLGVAGPEIPLAGRICAVADVFDALTSERPYRGPMSMDDALWLMKDGREKHFDPDVLDVFMEVLPRIQSIGTEIRTSIGPSRLWPKGLSSGVHEA